ncbi:hypothetical protein LTR66_016365 [Elasticomyces elasticus]|nr:hypothetical protein LTR66_016365 [Elasticomyces elasticus]
MNKLDTATFRFLPEISKINKELGNNSPTIKTLQERFLLDALTVDYLSATLHLLRAQAQGVTFNTGEFQEAAAHNLLDPSDQISENMLKITDVDRSRHIDGRTTVKFSKYNTEYSVSHPNEGAQISQTKANQERIAQLEERKLILKAGVEERKKPATGTHQKTDAQILAEGIIKDFTEQL